MSVSIGAIYGCLMTAPDLNLVRTFVAVYEAGSVTAAAADLNITQPSVTHALNRLRRFFGDDLFIRARHGVIPTATAQRIYPDLVRALDLVETTFQRSGTFDPHTAGRFTVAMSDAGEVSVLPQIVRALAGSSPRISLEIAALDVDQAEHQLLTGQLDAFVSSAPFQSRRTARDVLFREPYVLMHRRGHPRMGAQLTPAGLDAERHLVVKGVTGHAAPAAAAQSRGVDIFAFVPRFTALPMLVEVSDDVAIVPRYVAEAFSRRYDVTYRAQPWQLDPIAVSLFARHPHSRTAAQSWLVDFLKRSITRPGSEPRASSEPRP